MLSPGAPRAQNWAVGSERKSGFDLRAVLIEINWARRAAPFERTLWKINLGGEREGSRTPPPMDEPEEEQSGVSVLVRIPKKPKTGSLSGDVVLSMDEPRRSSEAFSVGRAGVSVLVRIPQKSETGSLSGDVSLPVDELEEEQ